MFTKPVWILILFKPHFNNKTTSDLFWCFSVEVPECKEIKFYANIWKGQQDCCHDKLSGWHWTQKNRHWVPLDTGLGKELNERNITDVNLENYRK